MRKRAVILAEPMDLDRWMAASADHARKLQRPLPEGAPQIVATGERQDQPAEAA